MASTVFRCGVASSGYSIFKSNVQDSLLHLASQLYCVPLSRLLLCPSSPVVVKVSLPLPTWSPDWLCCLWGKSPSAAQVHVCVRMPGGGGSHAFTYLSDRSWPSRITTCTSQTHPGTKQNTNHEAKVKKSACWRFWSVLSGFEGKWHPPRCQPKLLTAHTSLLHLLLSVYF